MPIQKKSLGKNLDFQWQLILCYETFREAGYLSVILIIPVALRNVKIFYSGLRKPDAILVGILTTGFDDLP
jgi:hypothetical protein